VQKLSHQELLSARLTADEASHAPRHPIVAVLHDIRSLYNVGSMFRTADAFAIERLYLCGYTPAPPRPEIAKTALGADSVVPFTVCRSAIEAISNLKQQGFHVFAAEIAHSSRDPRTLTATDFPLAIVFGNELTGVSDELLAVCDDSLEIPMYGTKHSLNVAVAAGIVLSTAVNRYRDNTT